MLSFLPGTELEMEMKRLQAIFVEVWNSLNGISSEESQYLNRFALISNIGASTRIENAVLTDHEIHWVDTTLADDGRTTAFEEKKEYILNKLCKEKERSIEEIVGCREVLLTVYSQADGLFPLSETVIRALHHDLLQYYSKAADYAGAYKKTPNKVIYKNHDTGSERVVLEPAPPGTVTETAMSELVGWYNRNIREYPWPILVATEFVFRFLAIHPFRDGNGRLARALFILSLLHAEDKYLSRLASYFAIDRHIEQNKTIYYTALHQCADGRFRADPQDYRYHPLVWFFSRLFPLCVDDIGLYRKRYASHQNLSESAHAVLDCFRSRPEMRMQVGEIVKQVSLPRRTIQYALKTLTLEGFLQRLGKGAASRYQLIF